MITCDDLYLFLGQLSSHPLVLSVDINQSFKLHMHDQAQCYSTHWSLFKHVQLAISAQG